MSDIIRVYLNGFPLFPTVPQLNVFVFPHFILDWMLVIAFVIPSLCLDISRSYSKYELQKVLWTFGKLLFISGVALAIVNVFDAVAGNVHVLIHDLNFEESHQYLSLYGFLFGLLLVLFTCGRLVWKSFDNQEFLLAILACILVMLFGIYAVVSLIVSFFVYLLYLFLKDVYKHKLHDVK